MITPQVFKLKDSRHPVIEKMLPVNEKFITNDLELDNNKKQIAIITGPNMAGKSTFLRQIGLISYTYTNRLLCSCFKSKCFYN